MTDLGVGDVLCTRGGGWPGTVIRFGAALVGLPNTHGHVAVFMGPDPDGRDQVIEGRPGGVGYRDAAGYLKDHWTIDNRHQPKTPSQRLAIAAGAKAMLGTPYDWVGIGLDGMRAIHAPQIYQWAAAHGKPSPNHVVCSSLADWLYAHVGLANPGRADFDRTTTPADWVQFITTHAWEQK